MNDPLGVNIKSNKYLLGDRGQSKSHVITQVIKKRMYATEKP